MNIQIMKTYHESFQNVRSHKMEWLRVAFGPVLIWALGFFFVAMAYSSGGYSLEVHKMLSGGAIVETQESGFIIFANIVYQITYFIAMISLYINGYRYAVLEEGGHTWLTLNLNMRFVKMFLYAILITLLAGIYIAITAGIVIGAHAAAQSVALDVILGIICGVFGFYLMFRVILYPVIISLDQSEPIRTSWRLLRGNVLRFIGLILLVSLTILVIGLLGAIILGLISALFTAISPVLGILSISLWVLFAIYMVLLGWALNSKVMGLVLLELSMDKGNASVIKETKA